MHFRLVLGFVFMVGMLGTANAQRKKNNGKMEEAYAAKPFLNLKENIRSHISILASDSFEGRRTGTMGEQKAAAYISNQFSSIGLMPLNKVSGGHFQIFEINEGREFAKKSSLLINGVELKAGMDFFPLNFSANGKIDAIPSPVLKERGQPWFINLKDELEKNKTNPHFDINPYVEQATKTAIEKGATAVVFYNNSKHQHGLIFDAKAKPVTASIPVIYINGEAANKYFKNETAVMEFQLEVEINELKRNGTNVIGYWDNGADQTIVIGAHYDHLGLGEDHNSLHPSKEPAIHNGADDNASGTAALIELGRNIRFASKKHNYLFIAFSGEELGLYGSKYFADNPGIELTKINAMINMDMIGRLNDTTKGLTVGGYGTSPAWGEVFQKVNTTGLNIKFDSSGTGPSDHTSFYRKNIPVLFFFTGVHGDYHKPSDDSYKINYEGEEQIVKLIFSITEELSQKDKLAFAKTRENSSSSSSTRFTVSLGIMPDYTYSGEGVKADGVSEGKLAQKLGIQAGDIIIQLGENKITSVETYMKSLSKFKKGDSTKVITRRGDKEISYDVTF